VAGRAARVALAAVALAIAGCASVPPAVVTPPQPPQPVPTDREPPPPNVNLSGFPLPYRQGYADGCASARAAERKDAARFAADANYRMGWQDGIALCRKR
jgi:hypothetical protein